MPKLFVHAIVKNFETWQADFPKSEAIRNQATITNPRIFQNADNPNEVLVVFDATDPEKVKSFYDSDQTKGIMTKTGVTSLLSFDLTA